MTGFGDLNLKTISIFAIPIVMDISKFLLNWAEHEKSFITSRSGHTFEGVSSLVDSGHKG